MHTKIFTAYHSQNFKIHWHWKNLYARVRQFTADYKLPLVITAIFLLLATTAALVRISQQSSLVDLLDGVTSTGQGYGTLLSKDKADQPKRNTDISQPTTEAPVGSPSSFALNPTNPPASSPAPSSPSGTGSVVVPLPVFSSSIAYFQQDSATLECSTPKPKQQTCSKRYVFGAGIRTQNGPGTVNYSWRSNLPSAIETSSASAGSGQALVALQKVITLACNSPSSFNLQLAVLSPSVAQSSVLTVNHNCNEI